MQGVVDSWIRADEDALAEYFGEGFRRERLPGRADRVEQTSKADIQRGLQGATRNSSKGEYDKGRHSFQLVGLIDPQKVKDASPHAAAFFEYLDQVCQRNLGR